MLSGEMVKKLIEIYESPAVTKTKRKITKPIVDSLIEQLCKSMLNIEFSGLANVRRKINREKKKDNVENLEILISLSKLLKEYDDAFSKRYSDHSDTFDNFLNNELKDLIEVLIDNEQFANSDDLKELKGLI